MNRRLRLAAAFAVVVLAVSLVPVPAGTEATAPALLGVELDKWVHAGSYGALTGLLVWGRRRRDVLAIAAVVIVVVGYGASVELLQSLVPTRDPSLLDAVANAIGAVTAGAALTVVDPSAVRRRWFSEQ